MRKAMNIAKPSIGTRILQRKLYLKAKRAERYRFYSLYDKISRRDILHRAYELVRQNDGSPGIDGRTFLQIEREEGGAGFIDQIKEELEAKAYRAQPVKRVYIPKGNGEQRPLGIPTIKDRVVQMAAKLVVEPIFEADFSDSSYGYRPKRHAHQAVDAITEAMRHGHTQVIDCDLSKYFDTIPHDKLMRTIAERISDGAVLGLIKQWLKAPIIEECQGKRKVGGGQSSRKGTPQGGVISPLLANIYLNLLDRVWQRQEIEKRHGARLVRYADDIVVLCRGDTAKPLSIMKRVLRRLDLTLSSEKSAVIDTRKGRFRFLGFSIGLIRSEHTGRWFPYVEPCKKAISSMKAKLKWITRRQMTFVPITDIVKIESDILRGWGNYFRYGNCFRQLRKVRLFAEQRLRLHLCSRHKVKHKESGYNRFPRKELYGKYGLYKLDIKPKWKLAQALG